MTPEAQTPRPAVDAETASFFDEKAEWYDDRYDRLDAAGHALRARMELVLRLLGPGPGEALDAGMGPGRLCEELEGRGWTVSGVDASGEMIAAACRRLPQAKDRFVQADIEALPFADASFDAVVATGVLEYADLSKGLDELARVLRPGGRAVVSFPNTGALYAIWKINVFYPLVRSLKRLLGRPERTLPRGAGPTPPRRFRQLLGAAGLEPESMEYASFLVVPSPVESVVPRLSARLGQRFEGAGPRLGRWLATQIVYTGRKPGSGQTRGGAASDR